jgi:hypothetical protein
MSDSKGTPKEPFIIIDEGQGQFTIDAASGAGPRYQELEPVESPYTKGKAVRNPYSDALSEQHVLAATEEDIEMLFNMAKKGDL